MVGIRWLVWAGGLALLAATVTDTIAVVGRHAGYPLTGSIELMQALVLVAGSISLVVATCERSHARVRLLVERLGPQARSVADRLSHAMSLALFLALLAGSAWIAADLWDGHEQSEILGVSWRTMRLVANACLCAAAVVSAWHVVRSRR